MYKAGLYHENNNIQKKTATICIEKYRSKIKWQSNNRIIDVGCAEGTVTTLLKEYLPENTSVHGCDINEEMVKLANLHHSDEQMSFTVLDITGDIPEGMKGYFSHVFSFFAINWIIDQESTFNNIYNLMEPEGECFLLIVGYNPIFDVYRNLARSSKWNSWVYNVSRYISPYHDSQEPEKEIKMLMETIGYCNIDIVNDHLIYKFPNMESMKGALIAICPFKIPDEMMDDFWEDYVQELRLLKGCDNTLKDISFNYKILTVHALKSRNS